MRLSQLTQSRQGSSLVIWERSVYRMRGEGVKPSTMKELFAEFGLLNLWGKQKFLPKVLTQRACCSAVPYLLAGPVVCLC